MINDIAEYIKQINLLYQTGKARELSYRSALEQLVKNCTGLKVIGEQARSEFGTPDFALTTKKNITVAYIETKDIANGDLDGLKKNKAQFDKYKAAVDTIVFTDYLDFHLYKDGSLVLQAELAVIKDDKIVLNEEALGAFKSIMDKLRYSAPQKISSPSKLAQLMADKAKLIADAILTDLKQDKEKKDKLWGQLVSFRKVLNKGLKENEFADLYAQTIAYGLFAARIHDNSKKEFTRLRAAECIPQTNPFLRDIFQQLAGFDISKSIVDIVDDLVDIFAATDVDRLRKNISKESLKHDPMIHFYEEFLEQYNPEARKKYGVYYTPQPVVEFIVRAVDDILKSDFGIEDGLADISKVDVEVQKPEEGKDLASTQVEHLHRVQILDPATGTGTFLAEVVSRIKERQQKGVWPKYVEEHLIPRIFGFEYMMAPYTIAHLKLDMLLNWWEGEKISEDYKDRLNIYLTNSLDQTDLLDVKHSFATMIAEEANKANYYKHNAPVMIVMGNPPYSGVSQNNGEWITKLVSEYRKEPNSKMPLQEKKNWLNDDYVKFIRLGQYFVDKNKEGILSYICSNGFTFNPTFRGMRWHLLNSFDKIYILNLHGRVKPKPETCPDGNKDENVFDITVGTSINIFVKTGGKAVGDLAEVYYADLYGLREFKYNYLRDNNLAAIKFKQITPKSPYYFFYDKNNDGEAEYQKGFSLDSILTKNTSGIVSMGDTFAFADSREKIELRLNDFINTEQTSVYLTEKYKLGKNYADFILSGKRKGLKVSNKKFCKILYRPFDEMWTYFDNRILWRSREQVMRHMMLPNLALIAKKGYPKDNPPIFVSHTISDFRYWSCSGMQGGDFVFPLYSYDEATIDNSSRISNLDEAIWRTIENWVKYGQAYPPLTTNEQGGELGFDAAPQEPHFLEPEDIFDYIYGVLHSPAYRAKYKEFLKVDFPRIPYPKNKEEFEHYKDCGHRLRELHLMHNVPKSPVTFEGFGNYEVTQLVRKEDNVYINDKQYFTNVPQVAWEFYIGGYQPAQKWLKDRKGRMLDTADIKHYENIISVLLETDRIMKQIDEKIYPELVDELKHKVKDLEQQLQSQPTTVINQIHIDTYNDNSKHISLDKE